MTRHFGQCVHGAALTSVRYRTLQAQASRFVCEGFAASNTTPVIVLRFEAETEAGLKRIQEDFRRVLTAAKSDVPLPY